MATTLEICILALLQGITEFLPISSSGHLAILEYFFGISETDLVTVVLHAGTLMSIIVFYRDKIIKLIFSDNFLRLVFIFFIASLPAGIAGVLINKYNIDTLLVSALFVPGAGLIITSGFLFFFRKPSVQSLKGMEDMGIKDAFIIGISQALAIIPGISRSGTTITTSLSCGYKGEDSANFSFFLAIPTIAGATFLKLIKYLTLYQSGACVNINFISLFAGFAISAVVGYLSLMLLIRILQGRDLHLFAPYCLVLGIITLLFAILKEVFSLFYAFPY